MEDQEIRENALTLADLNTRFDSKKNADQENSINSKMTKMEHIFCNPKISVQ